MKTYKHKKLGWIARKNRVDGLHLDIGNQTFLIPKELIEESNDRELIEENDWIDEFIDFINTTVVTTETVRDVYREWINKHLPKISEEEMVVCMNNYERLELLRLKGLLAE